MFCFVNQTNLITGRKFKDEAQCKVIVINLTLASTAIN